MTGGTTGKDKEEEARQDGRRSVLRSAGLMTAFTLLSRILGLVREQVRAALLGTSAASDAFGVATMLPNLFRRLFAEGAMTAAFLPVFSEYLSRGDEESTNAFLSRFVTLLTCVVAAFSILGALATPWIIDTFFAAEFQHVPGKVALTIALTEWMWPYLFFVSMAAALQAVLNAHKIFGPSAFTPVLLNACIIGVGLGLASQMEDPSYALVLGFVLGGIVQLAFQVPYLLKWTGARIRIDFRFTDPGVQRVLRIMLPGVFAAGIYQVNVFVAQWIASMLAGGSIAALQYSIRLQELVLGLFVVSVAQVILPTLSEHTAKGETKGVVDTLSYATQLMVWVTLPATVALMMIGAPILRLLFEFGSFDAQSTALTHQALFFHALGLLPIALSRVQSQVFFAQKDLRTPTIIAAVVMIVHVILCYVLAIPLGMNHGGIALAGSVAALLNTLIFFPVLRARLGTLGGAALASFSAKIALATAVMAGALWFYGQALSPETVETHLGIGLWVAGAVIGGGGLYVAGCHLLGVNELAGLLRSMRRRPAPQSGDQ
jgi:putative peptidoglycan lipid II flippase